jgi:hypothetical protein
MAVPQLDPAQMEPPAKQRRKLTAQQKEAQKQRQVQVLNSESFRAKLRDCDIGTLFAHIKRSRASEPYLVHFVARKDKTRQEAWQKTFPDEVCGDWWDLFHPAGPAVLQFITYAVHVHGTWCL